MKKLPIGISTLREILEENYLYVDKTPIALDLIERGKYYFLSRPRRFGKSLFLDTLRMIFSGEKELFKGLYIYDKYNFKPYPIIRISFNDGRPYCVEDLHQKFYELLDDNQRHLGIECPKDFSHAGCFKRLIEEAYLKYNERVVILIDEYDKPILDNIEEPDIARPIRDELKNFYSVIKGSDEYVKFVFITGVSKFSKVSLFSGLNNLQDITLNPRYATITGYTQRDVETTFAEHLAGQDFAKIQTWYNGYKWLGEGVYNPFDILLFISNGFDYRNYWFSTGTPTFLLKLIEKYHYFLPSLEGVTKDDSMLDSFDVDYIDFETLLWQTGYLTITRTTTSFDDTPRYHLELPNKEVRVSMLGVFADFLSQVRQPLMFKSQIYEALHVSDFEALQRVLTSLFAAIPYNNFTGEKLYMYEGYYASVLYAYIAALGFPTVGEDVTDFGRIDLTLLMPESIYLFEFKVDGGGALDQIRTRNYHEKYLSQGKPIYLVGIEFDTLARNVRTLEWEKV
ncbi:MAG: ATP-binding protein [Campylobacterales bacterium]|nr:ATP-binding protein [Campylobacterales bacterium]